MEPFRSSIAFAVLAASAALAGCHAKGEPTRDNFTKAMNAFLTERGDLCLGKTTWPIDVTQREFQHGSRNALQMPVLEHLGLVQGSNEQAQIATDDGSVTVDVKRYRLTDSGQEYVRARGAHESDFCVAKLSLDTIVGWELAGADAGASPRTAVVTYTYRIDAAPFTREPEVKRVFPAVDRVVQGAGTAQLKEGFTLTDSGWVADELLADRVTAAAR